MLQYMNKRGDNNPPQKKPSKFKTYKNNTFNSLNDVEYFLRNIRKFKQYAKIYKLFK